MIEGTSMTKELLSSQNCIMIMDIKDWLNILKSYWARDYDQMQQQTTDSRVYLRTAITTLAEEELSKWQPMWLS